MGKIPAILFGTLLASGLVLTARFVVITPFKPNEWNWASFANGQAAAELDEAFEEALPIRTASIQLWNALSYGVLGEARNGALVGADQWLFSREEFEWTRSSEPQYQVNTAYISEAVEALHEHGVEVALLFVPAKAQVESEHLGRFRLPSSNADLYDRILAQFANSAADYVPDVRAAMMRAKPAGDMFLRSDTHWTTAGAQTTARLACSTFGSDLASAPAQVVVTEDESVEHKGDLSNFLDLGVWGSVFPVAMDTIVPVNATIAAAGSGADILFGSSDAVAPPLALVGTSYSANPLWSFEAFIRAECSRDVINSAFDGEGPFEPMRQFISGLANGEGEFPEVVLWEIPVRYLGIENQANSSSSL